MFGRRRRLPAELRPALDRDERVLAWAHTAPDAVVVATNLGLHLPGRDGRLGWHEIHKASWTGRELIVVPGAVVEERAGYVVMADQPPITVALPDPGDVPPVVRTRVTRSVSFSSHHLVPGGGVRVVARRVPGVDGVSWAVRYDQGTDPHGPGVVDATDQLVASSEIH
ncbi:MAG TPA: hypothetical protein VIL37_02640 [Natronosporangium sp.]